MSFRGLHKRLDRLEVYDPVTPFERFRLCLAAIDRGDEGERQRLVRGAGPVHRTVPDYQPYAAALADLAEPFFMDLLETAAAFHDARTCGTGELDQLHVRLAGFVLRVWAAGWSRFCEWMGFPPFLLWQDSPSFDWLQRALKLTEEEAFTPAEFLHWLDRRRPVGAPRLTELPAGSTPEGVATALEAKYRELVCLHGGSCPPRSAGGAKACPTA
jgi:hypothetical protein